jgi:predicted permease
MSLFGRLGEGSRRILNALTPRSQFDQDLEEEMRLHRDLRTREFQESGISPEESGYAARRKFGNTLRLREEIHQVWGLVWLDHLGLDLRYSWRRLRNSPGFTLVAILVLALGIGANTGIFTLIQQVMLSPLPVARPQELYSLGDDKNGCCWGGMQGDFSVYSYPLYLHLRDHTPEFSELAAFLAGSVSVGARRSDDTNAARKFNAEWVSGNYFKVFEVNASTGRMLTPGDDRRDAPPVAVISYQAWQNKFASDPHLIGASLVIDGLAISVVGVGPPGFFGDTLSVDPPDFWLPLATEPAMHPQAASWLNMWNEYWLFAIGRLRPDALPAQVQTHVTAELQRWLKANYTADRFNSDPHLLARYKDISRQHIVLMPASGGVASTRYRNTESLQLLMAISGMVLLIACGNIANLLLARGATSRVQTAVRLALGASRARILRQTVTEGLLLATLGGAAGVWMSMAATRGILWLTFPDASYIPIRTTPSLPVLGFALAISLLTGLIFSAAPAWIASRTQPMEPMRGAVRSTHDHSALPQKPLIVLQAAVSLVLLVGAGLLTLSLRRLETQSFGIETQGRLVARIDMPRTQYPAVRLEGFYHQLQQQLSQIPGVLSSSLSNSAPMAGNIIGEPISIAGKPPVPLLENGLWPGENRVSPHHFETLGTRIVRGRAIDEHDTPSAPHVAVVDEAFARFYFPHEDPIGRHFGIQTEKHSHDYQIVGIAENAPYGNPRSTPYPTFFLPLLQEEHYEDTAEDKEQFDSKYVHSIHLHVQGRPESFQEPLRRALAAVDPNLTVQYIRTLDDQVSRNFDQERMVARLAALYGLLALILASVGLYGVASYAAARRTNEIGIRMALGADRRNVIALMLRGGLRPIALGLALGIPMALVGARLIASRLYGVKSYDPWIFACAVVVLSLSAMAAAYLPARRAASIDPMQALRAE